ncbi:MAG: hypothetical protein EKK37_01090 [Sphingobacteriales bacterium]|nr:MAG: hypothetical protein EKK37_01090 [Sphingobacteriales bacterium]
MMDFTFKTYRELHSTFLANGYRYVRVDQFTPDLYAEKVVVLRHDVDRIPYRSYQTAMIEHELGIAGTYYFRIVKESFHIPIIKDITALGHEIGYHYEDLALANGDMQLAIKTFEQHLRMFEDLFPVTTAVMHGSPLSKHDNRLMWQKFNYKSFGITTEPYFDIDFTRLLYLTDTGRVWNGKTGNVRDREMKSTSEPLSAKYNFNSTIDVMNAIKKKEIANCIMLNFHPERWTDNVVDWCKIYLVQKIKNPVKKLLQIRAKAMLND